MAEGPQLNISNDGNSQLLLPSGRKRRSNFDEDDADSVGDGTKVHYFVRKSGIPTVVRPKSLCQRPPHTQNTANSTTCDRIDDDFRRCTGGFGAASLQDTGMASTQQEMTIPATLSKPANRALKAETETFSAVNIHTTAVQDQENQLKEGTCYTCATMHRLIKLYQERDEHKARAAQTRVQIERDERDVARLEMTAIRYHESAKKKSELIQQERQQEKDLIELASQNDRAINDLQAQIHTRRSLAL